MLLEFININHELVNSQTIICPKNSEMTTSVELYSFSVSAFLNGLL